jgi:bifunctional non-homologous end joining protein LigD
LAIAVENHDLSFGDFEGEVPRGEYGAGRITIWDRGTYLPSRWGDDRITFELLGDRVGGTYTLTRFVRAGPDRWLLFKRND